MPKRRHEESKEDRWRRKLRKYERRLQKPLWESSEDELVIPITPVHYTDESRNFSEPSELDVSYAGPPIEIEPAAAALPPCTNDPPIAAPATPLPCTVGPLAVTAAIPSTSQSSHLAHAPLCATPSLAMNTPLDAAVASTSVQANAPSSCDFVADPELLQALGGFEAETIEWGVDIYSDLAKRWELILRDGLNKEAREELLKKYLLPRNCPLAKAPILNPEIGAMLTDSARNRDMRIVKKQNQMGCALSILGRTMTDILAKTVDTSGILRNLTDAAKIVADSHFAETETRRSLITPMVDKSFLDPFKNRKRDSHLFGDNLGEFIKSSRGIQKTGRLLQSAHLNSKIPPPSRQMNQRGSRASASHRGGGMKSAVYRRRAAPNQRAPRASAASPPPPAPRNHKQTTAAKRRQ